MNTQWLIQQGMLSQVTEITSGRVAALVPAFIGLVSLITGWAALARARKHIGHGRLGAITAIVLGLIDLVLSILHLIRIGDSSFGTGSGRLGAIVALVLGVIGIFLGVLVLARSKKNRI